MKVLYLKMSQHLKTAEKILSCGPFKCLIAGTMLMVDANDAFQ